MNNLPFFTKNNKMYEYYYNVDKGNHTMVVITPSMDRVLSQ